MADKAIAPLPLADSATDVNMLDPHGKAHGGNFAALDEEDPFARIENVGEAVAATGDPASIITTTKPRKRMPTLPEAEELRALIDEVMRDDSETERTEALTIACADPDAALLSLRTLRDELRLNEKWLGQRYRRPHEEL
jgi:hypothetical protein